MPCANCGPGDRSLATAVMGAESPIAPQPTLSPGVFYPAAGNGVRPPMMAPQGVEAGLSPMSTALFGGIGIGGVLFDLNAKEKADGTAACEAARTGGITAASKEYADCWYKADKDGDDPPKKNPDGTTTPGKTEKEKKDDCYREYLRRLHSVEVAYAANVAIYGRVK